MPTDETLREMHRQMVRARVFEETMARVYMEGKTPAFDIAAGPVPGEMHLAAGQEPAAVGVCMHLRPTDAVTATHRPHRTPDISGATLENAVVGIVEEEPLGLYAHCHCVAAPAARAGRGMHANPARPIAVLEELLGLVIYNCAFRTHGSAAIGRGRL